MRVLAGAWLGLALVLAAANPGGAAEPAADRPLKVAMILPGSVADGTFNTAAAKAADAAKKKFSNVSVSVRENTTSTQIEQAIGDYARNGYDVIVGYGFEFGEVATKVHAQYPKVWFIVNTAKVAGGPNLASFDERWAEAGYVGGAVASSVTKSGMIGTVGAIPVPAIVEYNDGFNLGAKRIKPDVHLVSGFVGSFTDVAKAKEITLGLIEQGADVVTATGNESVIGTVQAAKEKHVKMVGTFFDSAAFAPDTIVTTVLVNFDVPLVTALQKILDGSIEPKNYLLGFSDGSLALAGYGKFDASITDDEKQKISKIVTDLKAGKSDDLAKSHKPAE
jgi:basic membrane protein A